jgi:cytochrome c biogenesis protein CcdA
MTGILITFNLASFLVLTWSFIQGYRIHEVSQISNHIITALIATGLSVFSHCMIMMYFVGTGRVIRETVEKGGLDQRYVIETKSYRKRIFRIALLAMTLVMMQTILGGGVHTRVLPVWFHDALGILMLSASVCAVYFETFYLIKNHLLGHDVSRLFEAVE